MQIFQRENSDIDDKFMPKFNYIAKRIMLVYILLTAACTVSLYGVGMSWFDAANHAMSAIATCGLGIKNASVGFYDSVSVEVVLSLFMVLGALPMTFYIMLVQNQDLHSFGRSRLSLFEGVGGLYSVYVLLAGV